MKKFPIHIHKTRIISNTNSALTLSKQKRLGEKKDNIVIYSLFEAYYLIETKKAELIDKDKVLSKEQAYRTFSRKDKDFYTKYVVFRHLRKKGYIVKTAKKFGEEFRVYKKDEKHARWIVFPTQETKIKTNEFISKNRIAHSTAKNLLLAIVDPEEDILFYEVSWVRP